MQKSCFVANSYLNQLAHFHDEADVEQGNDSSMHNESSHFLG